MFKHIFLVLLLQFLKTEFACSFRFGKEANYKRFLEEDTDYQRPSSFEYGKRDYNIEDYNIKEYKPRSYKAKESSTRDYNINDYDTPDSNERNFKEKEFKTRDYNSRDYNTKDYNPSNYNKKNMMFDSAENVNLEEDILSNVDPKYENSLAEEAEETLASIRFKLQKEFKKLTSLDEQNQEKAKRTLADTHSEIDNRVGYLRQLLHKKREQAVGPIANVIRCVTDSLAKLSRVTPELMKDEEECISSELEMSRAVSKVTLDILRDNLQTVKMYQERINKCNVAYKSKKKCLAGVLDEINKFKNNMKASLSTKMAETVTILTGLSGRLRTCSVAHVRQVVTKAGDIIVKFNNCVKGGNTDYYSKKKKNSDMLLFVV